MDFEKDKADLLKQYAPELADEPDRYRILRNGSVYDMSTSRIVHGPSTVPVPKELDTRITSDTNSKRNGSKLANKRWDGVRDRTRQVLMQEAVKLGHPVGNAEDEIAYGVAGIWLESYDKDHKLSDRIRAQQHVMRVAAPGLLMDSRQRDSTVLEGGGMRLELSEGATKQLAQLLAPKIRGDVVDVEAREIPGEREADS